jgi:hypothetical protein
MPAQIPRSIDILTFALALIALGVIGMLNAACAADCLTTPDSSTPPNSHWYYQTDHAQQRKCWFLRADARASQDSSVPVTDEAPWDKRSQSISPASYSLASFKEFLTQQRGAKLSDQDVEQLYNEFLEWNSRVRN